MVIYVLNIFSNRRCIVESEDNLELEELEENPVESSDLDVSDTAIMECLDVVKSEYMIERSKK